MITDEELQRSSSDGIDAKLLLLLPSDNVCVARVPIEAGECVIIDGRPLRISVRIPMGHKLARMEIAKGSKIVKFGVSIGSASQRIVLGEHVHTHNLVSDYLPTYTLDGSNPFLERAK